MKTKLKKTSAILAVGAAAMMLIAGCGRDKAPEAGAGKGTVKLGYVNWAEGVAVTYLLSDILESLGYKVEATMADVAPIYTSVAEGNLDIMIETWLPTTHASYYERYGDRIDIAGTWFEDARIGLVVPTYVDIDSIEQLDGASDKIKGQITGIDSGAGIMGAAEKAIKEYPLGLKLLTSSGPAMTAALKSAIDAKEWIVVTGWAPHWKFARYELKFLEDPKGVFGGSEKVQAATRKGFAADNPEVASILAKMKFDSKEIGSLMDAVENANGKEAEAVAQWKSENQALVQSWLP